MMRTRVAALVLMLTMSACATTDGVISERLYFGQNIGMDRTIAPEDWQQFVATAITPRFPNGLTIFSGDGQWRDPHGNLVREHTYIVEIEHKANEDVESAIAAIAAEYKTRFHQDAVLRITEHATMRFY
jgi:hypothetical protein